MIIIKEIKRLVVKVGSSTITYENGQINYRLVERLVRCMADLRNRGIEVVLVTSGAIAAGLSRMGIKLSDRTRTIPERQAASAVGQCGLISMYDRLFAEYGQTIAQILITKDAIDDEKHRINAENTIENLLSHGVIPVVNENDTISTEELEDTVYLSFGDNDMLSAIVATLMKADLLVLFSDIDGFYTGDPKSNKDAVLIPVIETIDSDIEALAGGKGSNRGTGGMATKIAAAKAATSKGIDMIIANGSNPEQLYDIIEGKAVGTRFVGV